MYSWFGTHHILFISTRIKRGRNKHANARGWGKGVPTPSLIFALLENDKVLCLPCISKQFAWGINVFVWNTNWLWKKSKKKCFWNQTSSIGSLDFIGYAWEPQHYANLQKCENRTTCSTWKYTTNAPSHGIKWRTTVFTTYPTTIFTTYLYPQNTTWGNLKYSTSGNLDYSIS